APALLAFRGQVLELDGQGAFMEVNGAEPIIPREGEFTVECWAMSAVAPGGPLREILSQGPADRDRTVPGKPFYLGSDQGGMLRAGDPWTRTGVAVPSSGWHHYALVRGSDQTRLYLNGRLSATLARPIENPPVGPFRIGQQWGTDWEPWAGQVDDVRVWNVARSESQIRTNLSATLTGREPGLVGYWNFEDAAQPGRDLSPHARHGTLLAGATVTD